MLKGDMQEYTYLFDAILSLKTKEECAAFFDDLLTIAELQAAAQRLKVAGMLYNNNTCSTVAKATGASTATVSRVNKCLHYGPGGYKLVLDRLLQK